MHWDKSLQQQPVLATSRPYQGVRVRDPVRELLRRKRSQGGPQAAKTVPPAADVAQRRGQPQSPYVQGRDFAVEMAGVASDDGGFFAGWPAQSSAPGAALTLAHSTDYTRQDPATVPATQCSLAYSAYPADVYMQTLCPSYAVVGPPAMLTYTHTPLLTNFGGTIPMTPVQPSHMQMDLHEAGFTYIPWAQPLTAVSTLPAPGVQLTSSCAAALPGSPLLHAPLPCPPLSAHAATMPQVQVQGLETSLQPLDIPRLNPGAQVDPLDPHNPDEDPEGETELPNPLEKLLEDPKDEGEEGKRKDTYSNSLFLANI